MKPLIIILEAIHQDGVEQLRTFAEVKIKLALNRAEVLELSAKADVIIVKSITKVNIELLTHLKNLRIVGRAGTGVDNINLIECKNRGVVVYTVPTGNTISAAEFTIAQILMLCRRIPDVILSVGKKDYRRHLLEGRELQNMVVGIVGLGNVGMAVIERLKPFGCQIIGWDPYPKYVDKLKEFNVQLVNSFYELLPNIDILSFHSTLNESNHYMLEAKGFSLVKPGLLLINSARADLVEPVALLQALKDRIVQNAALDVLEPEPPFDLDSKCHNYQHPCLNHEKILITPHIGASTIDAQKRIALNLANQIQKYFE
jgi:D-3-phosphoglycerate dehydrogenase / 2-oxoglutarate reductase